MKDILKLLCIKHYIKNTLVFVPLVFAGDLRFHKFLFCLAGFAAFCLISSCSYIINDARDIERDRLHPSKKKRPLASGAVSVRAGACIAATCFLLASGTVLALVLFAL